MRYIRTYRLQASHFNSRKAYEFARRLLETQKLGYEDVLFCLNDIHGHNFKIVVVLERAMTDQDWIVDDVVLGKLVMDWDNRNLSLHQDFTEPGYRATTERLAYVLYHKLASKDIPVRRVEVWENDDICAETTGVGQ